VLIEILIWFCIRKCLINVLGRIALCIEYRAKVLLFQIIAFDSMATKVPTVLARE